MSDPVMLTLPARVDSDLGRPKAEQPVADLDRDFGGAELNAIQRWLVLFGQLFGKTDGSSADAVNIFRRLIAAEQPTAITASGSHTFDANDIGQIVWATGAGAQAFTLNTLVASLVSGKSLVLTVQCTGAATAVTITCGSGVTINGSSSAYAATAGRTRISLVSKDGLAWFTG